MRFKVHSAYVFPLCLLISLILASFTGIYFPNLSQSLKPIGDFYIHILLMSILPLVFFALSAAIAKTRKIGRILIIALGVYLVTGFIAAVLALLGLHLLDLSLYFNAVHDMHHSDHFSGLDFSKFWSSEQLLPLMFLGLILGFIVQHLGVYQQKVLQFLTRAEALCSLWFKWMMYFAPLGFFAYFANIIVSIGTQLLWQYSKLFLFYYIFACVYFVLIFSIYAYLADKTRGLRLFWSVVSVPALTALATCSSAACIPANFIALKKMHIDEDIYESILPIGSLIHKQGSVIGGMLKIVFLFAVFQWPMTSVDVLFKAICIAMLVGTVMGAIPSGGLLGELFIIHAYGFPPGALVLIAAISLVIDPVATMLNVTGNTISTFLIAKIVKKNIFYFLR